MNRRLLIRSAALAAGAVLAGAGSVPAFADGESRRSGSPGSSGPAGRRTPPPKGTVKLDHRLPAHPLLQYGAQVEPDRRVRVIVQKVTHGGDGHEIARAGEGTLHEEFSRIRSLVTEVPLRKVMQLALRPDVRYISYDGPVRRHNAGGDSLQTTYPRTVNADRLWKASVPFTGRGVGIAMIDSGCAGHPDLAGGVRHIIVNTSAESADDIVGHGTHVAGIIKGNSRTGAYTGIAPDAKLLSIKIADDSGAAFVSDLLRGLQWVADHHDEHGIRVVNLSISAGMPESFVTSPVAAAAEQLWQSGVVVVTSAGNHGTAADAMWFAPANDPYVITVGALDEHGTAALGDDSLATFSSRGRTQDGFAKPDVVAPGRRIVSTLAHPNCALARQLPEHIVDRAYLRLSGTSMAAPVVTGTVALLLEACPQLTPNQVKWLLQTAARRYPGMSDGAGLVDAAAAIAYAQRSPVPEANQDIPASAGTGTSDGSINWQSSYWDTSYWDTSYWDTSYWDTSYWDSSYWDTVSKLD